MGKEEYVSRLVDSMQATVDTLSKEVLIAINRNELMLKEKAFSAYVFNTCLLGVDFVYINVCISALAALKADNVHAKRYHWKNVVAGISEGIKYIYTFRGSEKKTLISYLKTILNDSDMMVPEITDSLSVLQDLLDKFTANWDGKDMRDYSIDNLAAERAIRPQTIQRKGSVFFGSVQGALRSAMYNTFIQTCKQVGVSFRQYFKALLKAVKSGRTDYENLLPMTICLD